MAGLIWLTNPPTIKELLATVLVIQVTLLSKLASLKRRLLILVNGKGLLEPTKSALLFLESLLASTGVGGIRIVCNCGNLAQSARTP